MSRTAAIHRPAADGASPLKKLGSRRSRLTASIPYFLMMTPGMLYLLVNNYIPLAGIIIAFKTINFSKGIFGSDWCGLDNFRFLFSTADAWIITRNTLGYNAAFILINTFVAVAVAIMLNEIQKKAFSRIYQSLILIPYLISMVIVSYLVFAFLSIDTGFLNKTILPLLGMKDVSWYSEPKVWPFVLTLVNTWKNYGYLCVIFLASIVGIDGELFEAATLDGATKWQQIRAITLPMIQPVVIMMTLLAIGRVFRSDFGLFYQVPMNQGSLYSVTNVIDTYVYRGLMQLGDIGMSAAAGLYQAVVGFILVLLSDWMVRRWQPDNSLF